MSDKVCTGHFCQGQRRPLTEFYVHKSGVRKGKPFSRCARCWGWQRDNSQGRLHDHVPMDRFMPVYTELVRRIGQTQTARRIGVAVDTISRRRLSSKDTVKPDTYDKAVSVLEQARVNGEDGWDYEAVRISNLRPSEAGKASVVARRIKARSQRWEFEVGMDAAYCEARWHDDAVEGRWNLADFECSHGRLSGDKTPACGCWSNEEV